MYSRQHVESMSEPVAEICADTSAKAGKRIALLNSDYQRLPIGTKLYLGPQPADAETLRDARMKWIESLFERKWNGVVGSGSVFTWYLKGDFRHRIADLHGETFDAAIDTAMKGGTRLAKQHEEIKKQLTELTRQRDELLAALELMKRDKWHWEQIRDEAIARVKGEL